MTLKDLWFFIINVDLTVVAILFFLLVLVIVILLYFTQDKDGIQRDHS